MRRSPKPEDAPSPDPPSKQRLEIMYPFAEHHQYDVGMQKQYRKECWQQTYAMGVRGHYLSPATGSKVPLDFSGAVSGVKKVAGGSAGRKRWGKPQNTYTDPAKVIIMKGDCVEATSNLAAAGYKPLLMDAASRGHFGGGYKGGSRAQEEEVCRRTTLPFALDTSLKYQRKKDFYPLPPQDGIYVPDITIFRKGMQDSFVCMDTPVSCGVGVVAAHNKPPLTSDKKFLQKEYAEDAEEMIRTFFQMGAENGHDTLVIVPLGCGAFQNPAIHIASIISKVIAEYRNHFKLIAFSVFDDHNAAHAFNPLGNFLPFALEVGNMDGTVYTDVSATQIIPREELEAEAAGLMAKWESGGGPKMSFKQKNRVQQ